MGATLKLPRAESAYTELRLAANGFGALGWGWGMDGDRQCAAPGRVFVGRRPELGALAVALAAARAGGPHAVLVQGEAGTGESSLIFEFAGRHAGGAALVDSVQEADAAPPF